MREGLKGVYVMAASYRWPLRERRSRLPRLFASSTVSRGVSPGKALYWNGPRDNVEGYLREDLGRWVGRAQHSKLSADRCVGFVPAVLSRGLALEREMNGHALAGLTPVFSPVS